MFSRRKIRNLQCAKPLLDPWPGTAGADLGQPLKQKREHADFHMGLNPPGQPVIHRGHLDTGPLERSEAPFDDHQPLVTAGGIFKTDRIIICLKHPLAVKFFGFPDRSTVYPDHAVLGNPQIPLVAPGGEKLHRPLGRGLVIPVPVEFLLKDTNDFLAMLPLPGGFFRVVAQDIPAPALAVSHNDFLCMEIVTEDLITAAPGEDFILIDGKACSGGVVEDEVDFEVEEVCGLEEDMLFSSAA
jgi:hypothetical protein